jgi:dTDP-glucose 4,6-dehydratase
MLRQNSYQIADDIQDILGLTTHLWEELRGGRLFITGATGFFGSWLLETIRAANRAYNLGINTFVLSRDTEAFKLQMPHLAADPSMTFWENDIRNFAFPGGKFSHVVHMAATTARSTYLGLEDPLEKFETLVQGTKRVLEFTAQSGAQTFLYTSSGAMYGRQPAALVRMPESYTGAPDPTDPSVGSVWGQHKRTAEFLCTHYGLKYGFNVKIARCFSFVGPYLPLDIHYAAGNFIRDALNGGPIKVNGDGTTSRSYMYPTDLMAWLWTILAKGRPGRAYNVGSEQDVTIAELARVVAAAMEKKVEVQIAKSPAPGAPVDRYVPDTTRAQIELGLKETVDLKGSIQRTINYYTTSP